MIMKVDMNLILAPWEGSKSSLNHKTFSFEDKQHMLVFFLLYLSSAEEATAFNIKLTKYLY